MTFALPIKLKLFALNVLFLMFLANCQPTRNTPVEVDVPRLPTETVKSVCLAWFNRGLPTWQDSDAEQTKDEIDLGYRTWDEVCLPFMKGT